MRRLSTAIVLSVVLLAAGCTDSPGASTSTPAASSTTAAVTTSTAWAVGSSTITTTVPPTRLLLRVEHARGFSGDVDWIEFESDGSYRGEYHDATTSTPMAGTVDRALTDRLVVEVAAIDVVAWRDSLRRKGCNALTDGTDWMMWLSEADGARVAITTCMSVFDGTAPIFQAVYDLVASTAIPGGYVYRLWEQHRPRLRDATYLLWWFSEATDDHTWDVVTRIEALHGVARVFYAEPYGALELAHDLYADDPDALAQAEQYASSDHPPGAFVIVLRGSEAAGEVTAALPEAIGTNGSP